MGMPDYARNASSRNNSPVSENLTQQQAIRRSLTRAYGTYNYGMPPNKQNIVRTGSYDIYSIHSGIVISIQTGENQSKDYGNSIIIKTAKDKHQVRYAHLDSIEPNLKIGNWVNQGQVIGKMGSTGNGIPFPNLHLHISVYPPGKTCIGANALIDPELYIKESGAIWPCNTIVSTPFHALLTADEGETFYYHEGTDFSGLKENFIKNWMFGVPIDNLN